MAALRTGTKNINETNAYQNDLNLLWYYADGQEEILSRKIKMFQSQDFVFTILKNGRLILEPHQIQLNVPHQIFPIF